MLRLRSLETQDVGVFSGVRQFDLSGRMIGVVGSNGRGKSTILSAIHYCMTGDNSRGGGSDSVAIRRAFQEQPFARLVFDVDGEPASVTRWLPDGTRSGRRRLVFSDQSWTAQEDVQSKIATWTGVPARVLSDFVFVEQGRLSAVVEDKPAKRAEVLHKLFGLAEAAKVRDELGDYLGGLPSPPDPMLLASLRARYVEAEAALSRAVDELATLPPAVSTEDVTSAREMVSRYSAEEGLRAELQRLTGERAAVTESLAGEPLPRPVPMALVVLQESKRDHDFYRTRLFDKHTLVGQLLELDGEIQQLQEDFREVPDPPSPPAELLELRSKEFVLRTLATAPVEPGVGDECPVCRGPFDVGPEARASASRDLTRMVSLDNHFQSQMRTHDRLVQNQQAVRRKCEQLVITREKLETQCNEQYSDLKPPGSNEDDVDRAITEYNELVGRVQADMTFRAAAGARLKRIEESIRKTQAGLGDDHVSRDVEQAARYLLTCHESIETRRRELSARSEALRESFESARNLLARAEETASDSESVAIHRQRVTAVRDILHRDAAPAQSVKGCLDSLAGDLNTTLETLRARFRVSVRDDGELAAEFRDGTSTSTIRADRISKGERAVLGLAWIIAAARRHAPGVGILCLDEPTDGLDRERVSALRSALSAWSESPLAQQCVVVTHERSLMGVFDLVIDLG